MQLRRGTILVNRYRITKSFGYGGYGAVYLAKDLESGTTCAVKENLNDSQEEVMGDFLREASMLFNMQHPNLPKVWDHFVVPGEGQYLVMEYIEGDSLDDILQKTKKPLPERDVLPWIIQVCDALAYLHSQKPPIIHRDVKPSNIRITPEGKAVLVDFGIAKFYDEFSKTSTVARAVTAGYSPLEQYGIGKTDERSDVYALGATMYKLLTNLSPNPSVDIAAGTADPPLPVRKVNPAISRETSQAIQRAMQLRIKYRTQSITKFKDEIERGLISTRRGDQWRKIYNIAKYVVIFLIFFLILFTLGSLAYINFR